MRYAFGVIVSVFQLVLLPSGSGYAAETDLQVGVAYRLVNPASPQVPVGHRGTQRYSEVHEDLRVHAVVIRDGEQHAMLWLAWDLCMLQGEQVEKVKQILFQKYQIPDEAICINASHTHSAPATTADMAVSPEYFDPEYAKFFIEQAIGVVDDAMKNIKPARLRYTEYLCTSVGINRRLPVEGQLLMRPNFAGPVDQRAQVIAVEDPQGSEVRAILVKYACHPVTVGPQGLGSDYPGFMRKFLETRHPGAIAVFFQGCCADVRIQIVNEKADDFVNEDVVDKASQFGRELGMSVEFAMTKPGMILTGPVESRSKVLSLPVVVQPESEYRRALKNKNFKLWGQTYCAMLDKGEPIPSQLPYQIQSFHFRQGDGRPFVCVAMEGEVFTEYGYRISETLKQPNAIVLGYSNRIPGYVPTHQAYSEGGYEVEDAYKYDLFIMPGPFRSDVESLLVEGVCELAR